MRFLTAIFCDDIRQEVGNKLSYVGCYSSDMYVGGGVTFLPKFCVHMTAVSDIGNPIRSLKFFVKKDGEVLMEAEMPAESLVSPPVLRTEKSPIPPTMTSVSAGIALIPFALTAPSILRVEAQMDGELIIGPQLRIALATPQSLSGNAGILATSPPAHPAQVAG